LLTKNDDNIKDWRSTGRRRGRRVLYEAYESYECSNCHVTVKNPPKDAPDHFEEIWPEKFRVLDSQLQVQHMTKELQDNTEEFLKWMCPSCHKLEDNTTLKGEHSCSAGV
jgi:hypothetical protein